MSRTISMDMEVYEEDLREAKREGKAMLTSEHISVMIEAFKKKDWPEFFMWFQDQGMNAEIIAKKLGLEAEFKVWTNP